MNRFILLIFYVFYSNFSYSQVSNSTFGRNYSIIFEKKDHIIDNNLHTSVKPYILSNLDSTWPYFCTPSANSSWLIRKWKYEHFLQEEDKDYSLIVNPILNIETGKELDNKRTLYNNTRGVIVEGKLGERLSFYSSFLENQSVFPRYLTNNIASNYWIVPGQGKSKWSSDSTFDYAMASGNISYRLSKFSSVQFGHGKNFIGDGYRSLILSDIAFNYPYLKIQTRAGIFQYTNLYMEHMDITSSPNSNSSYERKYASLHHLSANLTPRINIGFFESIIWRSNRVAGVNAFDINYLNPIIFYRPVEYSLNSSDNALMGINFKIKSTDLSHIYGQCIIDEFSLNNFRDHSDWWANKYGYQLGVKVYDCFKVKNLILQAEYNYVRPYTYSHKTSLQNYGHYNQSLAHPLGANFHEYLLFLDYRLKNWEAHFQMMKAKYGGKILNDPTSYGNDIFMSNTERPSDYGIYMYQGNVTELQYIQGRISYLVNPKTNLKIELGTVYRIMSNDDFLEETKVIFIALKSDLFNRYYDY